jgi:RNA polymerase sigma factor (sigma-70 family)
MMSLSSEDMQILDLEELFKSIVATYQGLLYQVALCIVGCRESACEVVQDTLMSAYEEFQSRPLAWRRTLKIQAWLCSIVRHKAQTRRTRENFFEWVSLDNPEVSGVLEIAEATLETPDLAYEREETAREVYNLLNDFSLNDRFLLKNRFVDKLEYSVIEERYNLSAGNARVRIHRILSKLRKGLEARGITVANLEMWTGWDVPLYAHIPYDISDFRMCSSIRHLSIEPRQPSAVGMVIEIT